MSFVRFGLQALGNISRNSLQKVITVRSISQSVSRFNEPQEQTNANEVEGTENKIPPESDRSKVVPVEISIKYLQSDAYKETYGFDPVWKRYRRNYKGQFMPPKTRKTCIRNEHLATSNPCPICRDEYLVLDYRNTELLLQFISEHNGQIISYNKTGLCQRQHFNLQVAIHKAKDYGTVTLDVPFRKYNYSDWYTPETKDENKTEAKSTKTELKVDSETENKQ